MELREEDFCANTSLYKCLVRCNMYKIIYMFELMLLRYLLVLERKTRGRQLHLAKCFGPKGPSSVAKREQNKSCNFEARQNK